MTPNRTVEVIHISFGIIRLFILVTPLFKAPVPVRNPSLVMKIIRYMIIMLYLETSCLVMIC